MQTDLYQRELRLQEDEIYRLEDYIEQYQGIIRGYRCEIAELKQELADGGGEAVGAPSPADLEFTPGAAPQRDADNSDEAPDFSPSPDADEAPPFNAGFDEAPPFNAGAATERNAAVLASHERREPASQPALLKIDDIDAVRLRVRNGDPAEGGEPTLVAAVTPLADGDPAHFEGEASVLLADASRGAPLRHVARWDFTAEEVEAAWVEVIDGTRLELALLLPEATAAETPTDRPLRLWVRLVDDRGRKTLRSIEANFGAKPFRLIESASIAAASPAPASAMAEAAAEPVWRRAVQGRIDQGSGVTGVRQATFELSTIE